MAKHLYQLAAESEAYRGKRDELLAAEMELRDQVERVAALRRELPQGPEMKDYVFQEGPADLSRNQKGDFFSTRLSELFPPGQDTLLLMHFMFGPAWDEGCPLCTLWADGYNGVASHLADRTGFAVVARAEIGKIRAYAKKRGWNNLRLLSSFDSTYTQDFGMEKDGEQLPGVSVFTRGSDGKVRHFYTGGAIMGENQYRGMDLLSPLWHYFDLLPIGRGDWNPKHAY